MLQKIRAAMSQREKVYQFSGFIQLDEAFFGGTDGKQSRGTDKMAAYVSVSTTDEGKPLYAKIEVTEHVNKESALDFATRNVLPGSTITTDGLNVYPQLKTYGYTPCRCRLLPNLAGTPPFQRGVLAAKRGTDLLESNKSVKYIVEAQRYISIELMGMINDEF